MKKTVFVLVGAVLLVGGCAGGPGSGGGPQGPVAVPIAARVLPLDAYRLADAEVKEIAEGRRVLLRDCVARFGLTLPEHRTVPETGPVSATERRYGISDAALAATDGYHLGDRDPRRVDGRDRWLHEVGPDVETVLYGEAADGTTAVPGAQDPQLLVFGGREIPLGGCVAEAKSALREPGTDPDDLVDRLDYEGWEAARAGESVSAAFSEWSSCMKEKGFDYPDPMEAGNDDAFQGAESSEKEIAVATSDIACKSAARVIDIWYAAEVRVQGDLVAQNREELEKIHARELDTLRLARQVLAR